MRGASLREILNAGHALHDFCYMWLVVIGPAFRGEWRSPTFLDYLDIMQLERDAVIEAHMDESDEEAET